MSDSDNVEGAISGGDIRFYDNYQAPLDAGDYLISIQQQVNSLSGMPVLNQAIPAGGPLTQAFTVVAPRFTLDPADIYSVFPPNNSNGAFDQNLPHVVLTKRNLPWERYLQEENKATPWLALLLLAPDEIFPPGGNVPASTLVNPTGVGTYRSSQLLNPPAGTLGPALLVESQDMLDQVTALTVMDGGAGYTSAPQVAIVGGGGADAAATASINNAGAVVALNLTHGGLGYTSEPQVTFSGGGGSGATATAQRGGLCRAIDITTEVFTRVTPRFVPGSSVTAPPTVDELKYLAHCRQVNPGDKQSLSSTDDGWFSIVIGNRFPSPGAGPVVRLTLVEGGSGYSSAPDVAISGGGGTGATAVAELADDAIVSLKLKTGGSGYTSPPTITFSGGGGNAAVATAQIAATWIAHLVSLEGFENYLTDAPSWPQGAGGTTQRVRLASLFSWSFTCVSEAGDFNDLMKNLIRGQTQGGAGLLLHLPITSDQQPVGSAEARVQQALNDGYTALGYETLVGDQTFAWYRGPFLPKPKRRFADTELSVSASGAMIYDQANGLFDESYAAAWQTGRLLALSDATFGSKVLQWRRATHATVNLLVERLGAPNMQTLLSHTSRAANHSNSVGQLRDLLKPSHVSRSFMNYFLNDFAYPPAAPGIAGERSATPVELSQPEPSPAASHPQIIRNLMAHPAVQQLLIETHGTVPDDDSDSPLQYIVNWLARLCLLWRVPFVNLVPDARMLPRESLRCFFVDPNYLDGLVAGAMSIGIQSSRDMHSHALLASAVSVAVQTAIPAVRADMIGTTASPAPQPSETMAGFLLRSSVVSGWPGLEVRAYASSDKSQPLVLSRMDRLAPDVLLCIFPQAPMRVEISEPREGLAFGHEDNARIDLRWVTNGASPIGAAIEGRSTVLTADYFRSNDPAPVLNVQRWQSFLQSQINAAYAAKNVSAPVHWGPAAFAIQMVRAPEELLLMSTATSTLAPPEHDS
jgi:hypothetical protein